MWGLWDPSEIFFTGFGAGRDRKQCSRVLMLRLVCPAFIVSNVPLLGGTGDNPRASWELGKSLPQRYTPPPTHPPPQPKGSGCLVEFLGPSFWAEMLPLSHILISDF